MNRSLSRVSALLLVAVLLASSAFAAPRSVRSEREPGLMAALRGIFEMLVPALGKAHGTMDPDGQPVPSTPSDGGSTTSDAHGTMDPDGRM